MPQADKLLRSRSHPVTSTPALQQLKYMDLDRMPATRLPQAACRPSATDSVLKKGYSSFLLFSFSHFLFFSSFSKMFFLFFFCFFWFSLFVRKFISCTQSKSLRVTMATGQRTAHALTCIAGVTTDHSSARRQRTEKLWRLPRRHFLSDYCQQSILV